MKHRRVSALLVIAWLLSPTLGSAQPAESPDWPCVQRKIAELSPVALWSGPPLDEALLRWSDDQDVAALVTAIAPRRVPVAEAEAQLAAFAGSAKPEEKAKRLTLVFAGLFTTLGRERSDVMDGIERYGRKQKSMAEQIRADAARMSDMRTAKADAQEVTRLNDQLLWETRIFNERRASLSYVCEVPTLIEQRLFALARAVQAELPQPR